jgi:sugar O-acyltransferase (sialic acid O-acetyltransferase NeuD family)
MGGKIIVLWGATGQAKVLHEFLPHVGYELVAIFDNDNSLVSPISGVPLHHGEGEFLQWCRANVGRREIWGLVAIGGARGRTRITLQRFLEKHGVVLASVAHPSAFVAKDVLLGKGSQILAHASICAGASLGEGCIVNTAASVDHECILGDGVHVGPGATLAGCVFVGDDVLLGTGAVVLPRIRIGDGTIVGAGAVVTRDIPSGKVVYGNPAVIVRDNSDAGE